MTVYAKCHGPEVSYLTDGKLYPVRDESGGFFYFDDDDGQTAEGVWRDPSMVGWWERIEQDETEESMLTECKHTTEAKWVNDEGESVHIDINPDGDIAVKEPARQPVYIDTKLLKAINEAVARHDAASRIVKGKTQ